LRRDGFWQPLRLAADTIKLATPHLGIVARNLAAARWGRSFATMWHAGVPVSQALEVSSRSSLNAVYEHAILRAASRTRQGMSLTDALADTDLLPRYLLAILRSGEMGGNPGRALEQIVITLEDEALTIGTQAFVTIVTVVKIVGTIAAVALAVH